jgi:predicted house-cleaning NTP pyrophosphatase (Maf/HAM1 superfamily)
MDIKEKLEGYFIELSIPFEAKEENVWVITDETRGFENVIITADDQVVTISVKVMKVPSANKESFYETLLKLNATDLIHGAYAIEGNNIMLMDSLEGPTMDLEEIQASLDAISLALSQHYPVLAKYRQ